MRRISVWVAAFTLLGAVSAMNGCVTGDTATTGTGGSNGTGGSSATGGSPATGGTTATGGTPATGGVVATGGTPATGGVTSTGGTTATGGVVATGGTHTGGTTGTGGVTSTGGTTATGGVSGTGGTHTGGTTGTGGTTATGGTTGTAGSSGFGQPACGITNAGMSIAKNVACTTTDPQLCYKTCGPASIGVKSETCTATSTAAGMYSEMSGCSFDPSMDYSCYKIPATQDASCPTTIPMAGAACTVATCVVCSLNGMYLDTGSNMKTGYCVCQTSGKWTCAANTAWPCPNGTGC